MKEGYSYPIGKRLGEGGNAEVFESVTPEGRPVAVKIIRPNQNILETKGIKDFNELDLLLRVKHPFINSPLDFRLLEDGTVQIVLPMGRSFYDLIRDKDKEFLKSIAQRATLCYQIGSAVLFLHQNQIYHCDLKEENCLIVDGVAKLSDLGGSFYLQSGRYEGSCGMTSFMAPPEMNPVRVVVKNKSEYKVDRKAPLVRAQKTEIWTLGIVFYFILSGGRLFPEDVEAVKKKNPSAKNPGRIIIMKYIPAAWQGLQLRMLEPDPLLRISTVEEVMQDRNFSRYGLGHPASGIISTPRVDFGPKALQVYNKRLSMEKIDPSSYASDSVEMISALCQIYNRHISVFALAVDVFYRSLFTVGNLFLKYLALCAFQLALKIYDAPVTYSKLLKGSGLDLTSDLKSAVEKCLANEMNIARDFHGVVMSNTIYNRAPSLPVFRRCYPSCFLAKEYLKKGPFRLCFEMKESAAESAKRESKDVLYIDFLESMK